MSPQLSQAAPQRPMAGTVLLVSNLEDDRVSLRNIFSRSDWKLDCYCTYSAVSAQLKRRSVVAVIAERGPAESDWRKLLRMAACETGAPKVIVTCRFSEASTVRELLDQGAYQVLLKPFEASEVLQAVGFAWRQWQREQERQPQQKQTFSVDAHDWQRRIA